MDGLAGFGEQARVIVRRWQRGNSSPDICSESLAHAASRQGAGPRTGLATARPTVHADCAMMRPANTRARPVVVRADDDNPKELFVYHQAGLDGRGGSSYIDSVILRQPDADSDAPPLSLEEGRGEGGSHSFLRLGGGRPGWGHSSTSSADGTLEERRYSCQNPVGWASRPSTSDSAIITSGGLIVEWAKYSSYGIPFGLPGGDTDSDGDCDSTDITQIQTWIDAPAYDVRGDINLDGSVNATDKSLAISNYQGTTSGWNVLSAAVVANLIGYAGYQKDINLDISHVRNRVLDPHLGRWTRRDPLGYVDGINLYNYGTVSPVLLSDFMGTASDRCDSGHYVMPLTGPLFLVSPGSIECMEARKCIDCPEQCGSDGKCSFAISICVFRAPSGRILSGSICLDERPSLSDPSTAPAGSCVADFGDPRTMQAPPDNSIVITSDGPDLCKIDSNTCRAWPCTDEIRNAPGCNWYRWSGGNGDDSPCMRFVPIRETFIIQIEANITHPITCGCRGVSEAPEETIDLHDNIIV